MKVTIFNDFNTINTWVEFKEVVEAIRLGKNRNFFFAPSGVIGVSGNKKNTLIYSGLMMLNLSANSNDELENLFQKVIELSTTYCSFKSHDRASLIVIVRIDCSEAHHKTAYQQVVETYENYLNLKVSDTNSDIFTLCPLSYDPNIFYNPDSSLFEIEIKTGNNAISEAQKHELYRERFEDRVKYTEQRVPLVLNYKKLSSRTRIQRKFLFLVFMPVQYMQSG